VRLLRPQIKGIHDSFEKHRNRYQQPAWSYSFIFNYKKYTINWRAHWELRALRRTLEQLRRDVKLNLCDKCYQVYLGFIEPGIRELIVTRLDDMKSMESIITQMVMVHKGVFKTDMIFISIGKWDDKLHEDVHKDLFYEIKKWRFKRKIDYLKKVLILPESCYTLIDKARDRRNLIHEHPLVYKFTDEDLELFSQAHNVSANLLRVMRAKFPEDVKQRIISRCETSSQRYLAISNL
jgi:hypothetical protein